MSDSSARDFRTPVGRARGLGSAKSGTGHFWWQRVTAIFLALLTPWILGMLIALVGAGHAEVQAALAKPVNAIALALFALSLFCGQALGVALFGRVIAAFGYAPSFVATGVALLLLALFFAKRLARVTA